MHRSVYRYFSHEASIQSRNVQTCDVVSVLCTPYQVRNEQNESFLSYGDTATSNDGQVLMRTIGRLGTQKLAASWRNEKVRFSRTVRTRPSSMEGVACSMEHTSNRWGYLPPFRQTTNIRFKKKEDRRH